MQRFRILELDHSRNYLMAKVRHFPLVNGGTKLATELAQIVRPRIVEYVDLLGEASNQKLQLDGLPDEPTALALLVAISMQVSAADKQKLLESVGIPEMLAHEAHLLSRECLFTRFMIETQHDIFPLNSGPTGYIFPN
jgi:ATP-dependent Lon protease